MNGRGGSNFSSIPPGWDRWFELPGSSTHDSSGYDVNDQGHIMHFDAAVNDSELAYKEALDWINQRTPSTTPFFIQYSPTNPHAPYTPTATHAHDYDPQPARNVPSVNEADMSDKPAIMQKGLVSVADMENAEEGMREELEDTEDFIADLLDAAERVTGNSNLLVIFTSDNGFQAGEHRLIHKSWPYQECVEIPLIVRGTGLPAQQPTQLVSSVDISWTILEFAGVAPPRAFDGRSLHEIVLGSQPAAPWRKRVLIEDPDDRHWQMYREFAAGKDFAFIRHLDDPTPEFYDLTQDPFQLDSNPSMVTADMRSKLDRLTSLTGADLRAVEEEDSTTPSGGGDTTAPTVMSTVPGPDAKGVSPTTNVTATFSEPMDAITTDGTPSTITSTTFKLFKKGSTTKLSATVSYEASTNTATLDPTNSLRSGVTYKAVVTTGAKDLAGKPLAQQYRWFFTVG